MIIIPIPRVVPYGSVFFFESVIEKTKKTSMKVKNNSKPNP